MFKSQLLKTAAPPDLNPKIRYVYLGAEAAKLIRDLEKCKGKFLILEGVAGVSSSAGIFHSFGNIDVTIPYREFLSLNNVERVDYKDHDDIVKNTAMFYSRIVDGELVEANYYVIRGIISSVLYDKMDSGKLKYLASKDFDEWHEVSNGYRWTDHHQSTLQKMLRKTSFDSVNELVWFILMFLERTLKCWDQFTDKDINKIEEVLRSGVKDKIRQSTGYTGEKELIIMDKRLVLPHGTSIHHLYNKIIAQDGSGYLFEKLRKFGITMPDGDDDV
jgi:hypothetical protein